MAASVALLRKKLCTYLEALASDAPPAMLDESIDLAADRGWRKTIRSEKNIHPYPS